MGTDRQVSIVQLCKTLSNALAASGKLVPDALVTSRTFMNWSSVPAIFIDSLCLEAM